MRSTSTVSGNQPRRGQSYWSRLGEFASPTAVVAAIEQTAREARGSLVVTANIQHVALASKDDSFRELLESSTILLPDGWPVAKVLTMLMGRKVARITGADLIGPLFDLADRESLSVALFGGSQETIDGAIARLKKDHKRVRVVYTTHEAFPIIPNEEQVDTLAAHLISARPDLILSCVGTPKSERLSLALLSRTRRGSYVCFGAGLDFFAGTSARAPLVFRTLGLEWLFRMSREPRRLARRYGGSIVPFLGESGRVLREWKSS